MYEMLQFRVLREQNRPLALTDWVFRVFRGHNRPLALTDWAFGVLREQNRPLIPFSTETNA